MNISRAFRRQIRPLWMAALATTAWINRDDLRRWIRREKPARATTPVKSAKRESDVVTALEPSSAAEGVKSWD